MKPLVAIVGRPNVGKSSLFNRLTRSKDALVDDFPGVTRDRIYGSAQWDGREFSVVDTGGFIARSEDIFAGQVRRQIQQALEDADVVVLVLDGRSGPSPFDIDLIKMLRSLAKPVLHVVNKIDGPELEHHMFDFFQLGLAKLIPVSAEHGYGVKDFLDALTERFPVERPSAAIDGIGVAVVGRPNVGKSSLINRLLGQERLMVSEVPGTTRDAVDTYFEIRGQCYRLIDTAGIRRKSRVSQKIEKFSVLKALKSLERCEVALIVIDASEGITDQDVTIAGYAHERGCGCLFLLNKWDKVAKDPKSARHLTDALRQRAKFLSFAPVLTLSALTGLRVTKIFSIVDAIYDQYSARVSTGQVNRIIQQAVRRTAPSLHRGRPIKLFYSTQVATKPPTFVSFANYPHAIHFSYRRYLINQIREQSGLDMTPLRLFFRLRSGKMTNARPRRGPKAKRRRS